MNALEDLMHAALTAPPERREEALRLLQGQLPKPEPYLTLTELGSRLGLSGTTLRRWRIPGHDLGGRLRYRLSEVEAYFRSEDFQRRAAALRAERRHSPPRKH
ncbi:MAG: helix-turn-helix domain-containing protein [Verrucomicrobiales bacterium]|nr:helix-turn-helix domain-containing protein [Verrucomicrobiales bacterium]